MRIRPLPAHSGVGRDAGAAARAKADVEHVSAHDGDPHAAAHRRTTAEQIGEQDRSRRRPQTIPATNVTAAGDPNSEADTEDNLARSRRAADRAAALRPPPVPPAPRR